jgi:hypothetical protein
MSADENIYQYFDSEERQSKKESLGLMYGKMGQVVHCYLMHRLTNKSEYEGNAEKLLDEVISGVPDLINTNFDIGLCGIGYAIEYLIQNNHISGDSNKILYDFDDRIFRSFNENEMTDLSLDSGLTGYLLYFLDRLENKSDELTYHVNLRILKEIVNRIYACMQMYIDDMVRDFDFDLLRPFPLILNCFADLFSLDIYRDKISNSVNSWIMYLTNFYPNLHSNRLTFALSLYRLNEHLNNAEIDSAVKNLLYSVDTGKIEMFEIEPKVQNIRHSWMGLAVVLNSIENRMNSEYPNYYSLIDLKEKLNQQYNLSIKDPLLIDMMEGGADFHIKDKNSVSKSEFIEFLLPYRFE